MLNLQPHLLFLYNPKPQFTGKANLRSQPLHSSPHRIRPRHQILENPSLFSFRPDLRTHLSLSLRVLSERKFSLARKLLKPDILVEGGFDIPQGPKNRRLSPTQDETVARHDGSKRASKHLRLNGHSRQYGLLGPTS